MPPPARFPRPARPGPAPSSPGHLAAAVARLLARHGLTRIYTAACHLYAVISVTAGLTIWTNGRQLWWDRPGQPGTWPADDPEGAAHLAGLAAPPPSAGRS